MDFDLAAKRLQREQKQSRYNNKNSKNGRNTINRSVIKSSTTNNNNNSIGVIGNTNITNNTSNTNKNQYNLSTTSKELQFLQQQQQNILKLKRQQKILQDIYMKSYIQYWDCKLLHIQSLLSVSTTVSTTFTKQQQQQVQQQQQYPIPHLQLQATSIHGDGDKITLPPSILETLLVIQEQQEQTQTQHNQQQPWTFRIGIRNPMYKFPASVLLQSIAKELYNDESIHDNILNNDDNDDNMDDDDEDDDDDDEMDIPNDNNTNTNNTTNKVLRKKKQQLMMKSNVAYIDELQHYYISYTHGTVMEFTQDEGYIGIPKSIANVLLLPSSSVSGNEHDNNNNEEINNNNSTNSNSTTSLIKRIRTKDPAAISTTMNDSNNETTSPMEIEPSDLGSPTSSPPPTTTTPGHVAYNAFDIPDLPIEISLIQLPKGKSMTLRPTNTCIQNGYNQLQTEKLKYILEQSIVRTRATITLNDILSTWYRGQQYDFHVIQIIPNTYNAISCINTDIEIEFDHNNNNNIEPTTTSTTTSNIDSSTNPSTIVPISTGRRLNESTTAITTPGTHNTTNSVIQELYQYFLNLNLLPEPLIDDDTNNSNHIITIQFRYQSNIMKRKYDITKAYVYDLFSFVVQTLFNTKNNNIESNITSIKQIQLTRRYPRYIIPFPKSIYNIKNDEPYLFKTLIDSGFQSGNELWIVEEI